MTGRSAQGRRSGRFPSLVGAGGQGVGRRRERKWRGRGWKGKGRRERMAALKSSSSLAHLPRNLVMSYD
mgnify:CR=1 FL=1